MLISCGKNYDHNIIYYDFIRSMGLQIMKIIESIFFFWETIIESINSLPYIYIYIYKVFIYFIFLFIKWKLKIIDLIVNGVSEKWCRVSYLLPEIVLLPCTFGYKEDFF